MCKYVVLFALACTSAALAAQTAPPSQDDFSADTNSAKPLTLTGCIAKTDDQLKLVDAKNGTYHLSGSSLRRYLGKRVQVTGFRTGGLGTIGGLLPSPNVAAQAGAIDPAWAAVAAMPGGPSHGTNPAPVVEFRVKTVQTLKEVCP